MSVVERAKRYAALCGETTSQSDLEIGYMTGAFEEHHLLTKWNLISESLPTNSEQVLIKDVHDSIHLGWYANREWHLRSCAAMKEEIYAWRKIH